MIEKKNVKLRKNLDYAGNSKQKWENMLTEITNMEYMVVKCNSLIRKLFPNVEHFGESVSVCD